MVISCTTDGFITNFKDLEKFTIEDFNREGLTFTSRMAEYRGKLGFAPRGIELKNTDPKGIISIRTRGQLGLDSKISALTGFNKFLYSVEDLREIFIRSMKEGKKVRFPATRLMSGIDIIKKGGHVTMITREQDFSLNFDSKRSVINEAVHGNYGVYYNTKPFKNNFTSNLAQGLGSLHKTKYSKKSP